MKKSLLFLALLFLNTTFTFASYSIDWMSTPDLLANTGTAIVRDANDNVYSTTSTEGTILLEKRNRFGVLQWQAISSTTIPLNYEDAVQIHVDPQGNPVVIGYRYSSSSHRIANSLIILKYSPTGVMQYKRTIDGTYSYFSNSQYWTRITSQMDVYGYVYIGTAGLVSGYPNSGFNVLKISPNGYTVRISTKNFPSTANFHMVSQIRLFGNKLGLAGVTTSPYQNATTWVLDTAGTDLWDNIVTGEQGKDIAFDNSGNAYMLTWISIAQMGDLAFYKFDAQGNQTWVRTIDLGGSEAGLKLLPTPDGNFAIMASGNQAPTISYYIDWLTLKVDTSGTVLWSDRYDETTHNDEYPGAFVVDAIGNIFVTGIGGPFPGGTPIISARQMVTVKYTPTGTREWASPVDTLSEYNQGVGIIMGSDSSIFVLGNVNTLVIHYLDHTGSAPCSIPTAVTATVLANDSAQVSWAAVSNAYLYHVQYKTATAVSWETVSCNSTSIVLNSLYPGTIYDFKVEAICNSGPTGYSASQQFTTSGTGYCESMGLDATHDWIDLVFIENLLNSTSSSAGGYGDYTALSTTLVPGNTYTITLSAEMDPLGSTESWKIWIDFNGNRDFSDPGEEVVSYTSTQIGWETSTFQVPATTAAGIIRMRVSMKNGSPAQTPCEIFALGEVEDYTVNISSITGIQGQESSSNISVFPNPTHDFLRINSTQNTGTLSIQILDLSGRVVFKDPFAPSGQMNVDVHELSNGFYVLQLVDENGFNSTKRFLKD